MPDMPKELLNIGQDKQYKEAVDQYDAEHGEYKDNVKDSRPKMPGGNDQIAPPYTLVD